MKRIFSMVILACSFNVMAEGVHCLTDLRREGGPYEEVKLLKQGTTFKLNLKQSAPGATGTPTEKTLLDGLKCQFATGEERISFCEKAGARPNDQPSTVLFRKLEITQLMSLENRIANKETLLEVEISSPQVEAEQSGFNFLLNDCKKI